MIFSFELLGISIHRSIVIDTGQSVKGEEILLCLNFKAFSVARKSMANFRSVKRPIVYQVCI